VPCVQTTTQSASKPTHKDCPTLRSTVHCKGVSPHSPTKDTMARTSTLAPPTMVNSHAPPSIHVQQYMNVGWCEVSVMTHTLSTVALSRQSAVATPGGDDDTP
jgi:hypothetical protein